MQEHNVSIIGRFSEKIASLIKIRWKLGHVVEMTSLVNESQAPGSSSQAAVSSPTFILSKL